MNALIGLIGIITGHVGAILSIIGYIYVGFVSILSVTWDGWLFMALHVVALGFMVWGLLTWIWADADTNWATTVRTWRTNLIAHGIHAILSFIAFATWLIIAIIGGNFLAILVSFGLILGGFVLAAAGLVLIYWLKDWWFNVDPEGMMRYYEGWSLFGTDEDWEEPMEEEEEEMAEEEPMEEEAATEEEW